MYIKERLKEMRKRAREKEKKEIERKAEARDLPILKKKRKTNKEKSGERKSKADKETSILLAPMGPNELEKAEDFLRRSKIDHETLNRSPQERPVIKVKKGDYEKLMKGKR